MVEKLRRLGSEFGVRFNHHTDQMFEFFTSFSDQMDGDILEAEITFENILFPLKSVTEGMMAHREDIVEDASQAEDINLLCLMRIFEFVITLVKDYLARLPSNASFNSLCVIRVHLRIKLLGKTHI